MSTEHVIVTGAASGIGQAAVRLFVGRGALVTATDVNAELAEVFSDVDAVRPVVGDVTDFEFCSALVRQAESVAPVTTLFHSAGIMPGGEINEVDVAAIRRVMDINYGDTVNAVKAVLPSMRTRGYGCIVIMGSLTGYFPTNKFTAYSASKAAVNVLTETLAVEEKPHGIAVLLVAPNAVKTPLLRQAAKGARRDRPYRQRPVQDGYDRRLVDRRGRQGDAVRQVGHRPWRARIVSAAPHLPEARLVCRGKVNR